MSMMGGPVPPGRENVGESVASYSSYEAAQKAVSTLISHDVPAADVAIVGKGLRSIERVTGKLGYAAAARSGAVNGIFLGLLFSFVFVLGTPTVHLSVFLGVLLIGVAIGMLMSLVTYSIVRRRRDFASVMQITAEQYEVCVQAAGVAKARSVLGAPAPVRPATTAPTNDAEPPRYGERLPPASPEEGSGPDRSDPSA